MSEELYHILAEMSGVAREITKSWFKKLIFEEKFFIF